MNRPFNIQDQKHLFRFRKDAAAIIRDILSAVEQNQPELLDPEVKRQWWNTPVDPSNVLSAKENKPSTAPPQQLLKNAGRNLQQFTGKYAGTIDSIAAPDEEGDVLPETPAERVDKLKMQIIDFADGAKLKEASRTPDSLTTADWRRLCDWESLPEIRRLLDCLPSSSSGSEQSNVQQLELDSGTIKYQGRTCNTPEPTPKVLGILRVLLPQANHTAYFSDLWPKVWDDQPTWTAVHSAVQAVRDFFSGNGIPCTASANQSTGYIRLADRPSVTPEISHPEAKRKKAPKPTTKRPSRR